MSRRGSRSGKSKKGNGYSKDGIEFHKTPFYAATVTDLLWFAQVGRNTGGMQDDDREIYGGAAPRMNPHSHDKPLKPHVNTGGL